MGIFVFVSKCFVFAFNIVCLILGIGVIFVNALGLKNSLPGTDEHIFFIVGIILSSLVCMTTILGCYGIVEELIGVNIVYSFFIFMLLLMQYLQMENYPTHSFYSNAVERLEHSWRLVETQSYSMNTVEKTYQCCGLYDSRDYNYKGLRIPKSCYLENDDKNPTSLFERGCLEVLHDFYQIAIYRQKFSNWSLFFAECIVFISTCIVSILLYMNSRNRYSLMEREPVRGFVIPQPNANHVGSRTVLIQD